MDGLIKLLDETLEYISHELIEDTIYINVKSNKIIACCPDCNKSSHKIHSRYTRSFQDLPISEKKSIIILNNRKFFVIMMIVIEEPFLKNLILLKIKLKRLKD